MTLKGAIITVQEEYDREIKTPRKEKLAQFERTLKHEYNSIAQADLIFTITEGRTILPLENFRMVSQWIIMAFRLGMRVQRKLDRPQSPTSILDYTYDKPAEFEDVQ